MFGNSVRRVLIPLFLFLSVQVGTMMPGVASQDAAGDRASFNYAQGASISGTVSGECEAHGIRFLSGSNATVGLTAESFRFTLLRTWINRTILLPGSNPQVIDVDGRQYEEDVSLEPGRLEVQVGHGVVPRLPPEMNPIRFHLASTQLRSEPVVRYVPTGLSYPSPFDERRVMFVQYPIDGPTRLLHTDESTWTGDGHLLLLLDEGQIRGTSGFEFKMPPYQQVVRRVEVPGVAVHLTLLFTHARLEAEVAHLSVPSASAEVACGALHLRVGGSSRFHEARGQILHEEKALSFQPRELEIRGTYDVKENTETTDSSPSEGHVESTVAGTFEAVGLDYLRAPLTPKSTLGFTPGFWAAFLVSAALLVSQWSRLVGLFYTRFNESKALEHPTRAHLWAAIEETPGLILATLAQRLGRPLGVIRHHVRILEVVGLVKSLRVGSARHLYPKTYSLPVARREERWGRDAPARFLVERLREASLSVTSARQAVRIRFGFSRMGAWKVVRRAVQDGLVRVEPESHQLRPVA